MILQQPRVIRFQKYFFIFFISYRFCAMACTKIINQVLVAANGSGYVIENRILQHLMITRIPKYFLIFFILYGFCVVAKKQKRGQVLLAANGSSYTTVFINWWYFSMTRIQICF